MKPSPEQTRNRAAAARLSSMWRLCKLGYRHEPRLMLASFVLSQLAALPDALLALVAEAARQRRARAPHRV